MATPNESLVFARFFTHTAPDEVASKKENRPMFKDYEAVEIRFAANKKTIHVAPAHEVFKRERNFQTGEVNEITYAMAYNDQYKKFKAGEAQDQSGTPLSELTFLTASKRLELKALNIHTAEALAALDGTPLKQLGMGGRELKNQAQAYLDAAKGSVDVVAMAAQIAALQELIASLKGNPVNFENFIPDEPGPRLPGGSDGGVTVSPFADMAPDDIKNWIESATGERPKGNPNHATLVKRADEVNAALAEKAKAAA